MKRSLKRWRSSAVATVVALITFPVAASFIQLVSQHGSTLPPVAGGGGSSQLPITSADERYVLFASTANNLTVMSNGIPMPVATMPCLNVYVRDYASNTTTLVSVNIAGTAGGNGDSLPVGISTNGQCVLFESTAGNLVANDINNAKDVFVRDLINGTTTLVSVNTNGWGGNGASRDPAMTPDERYVAFVSAASDLVPGDTNGIPDVFVRDLQTQTTTQVSVGAISSSLVSSSESPEITPDGRYVGFFSTATNLVPGVTTTGEIYVRDLVSGTTTCASAGAHVIFQSLTGGTNEVSCNFGLSADGQFVGFEACSNPPSGSGSGIILRYNVQTDSTGLVYSNAAVFVENFANVHNLKMTPDGRFIAFVANVGSNPLTNTAIYLWDAQTGTNRLVSPDQNTGGPAIGICDSPVISTNGQYVAFLCSGSNLVTNPLFGQYHLYLRDMQAGSTTLLDMDTNGMGAGVNAVTVPSLSDDGSVVAFDAPDGNLVVNDRNHDNDIFVRYLATQTTEMVSDHAPTLPSLSPSGGASALTASSVSANGRCVAFFSDADKLTPNDTNGNRDVFVRDLMTGTNIPVSLNTNGVTGDGISTGPSISGDGRYVTFTSSADDLVPNDTNNAQDVFVRDLQAGTTTLVSVGTNGINSGNGDSFSPTISVNGRYVLFHSKASNLAAGSSGSGYENLFFRDLQTETTYVLTVTSGGFGTGVEAASMTPDGQNVAFFGIPPLVGGSTKLCLWNSALAKLIYTYASDTGLNTLAVSSNGEKLAGVLWPTPELLAVDVVSNITWVIQPYGTFRSSSVGLQFSGDGRFLTYTMASNDFSNANVYLYDFQAGTNVLISRSPNTLQPANDASDSPTISADGRFIAYRSVATDLVAGSTDGIPQLIVYDRLADSNTLLSTTATGAVGGDNRSLTPVFSSNGRTLVFAGWASNLAADDFNHFSDLFAYAFFYLDITLGAPAPGPTVSWPYVSGYNYQVEYKNNLTDSAWQPVAGTVHINGNQAFLTDPVPVSGQRFYRVVAQ